MIFGALRLYYVTIMDFTDVTASQLSVVIAGTRNPRARHRHHGFEQPAFETSF